MASPSKRTRKPQTLKWFAPELNTKNLLLKRVIDFRRVLPRQNLSALKNAIRYTMSDKNEDDSYGKPPPLEFHHIT